MEGRYTMTFPDYTVGVEAYEKIREVCPRYGKTVVVIGGRRGIGLRAECRGMQPRQKHRHGQGSAAFGAGAERPSRRGALGLRLPAAPAKLYCGPGSGAVAGDPL